MIADNPKNIFCLALCAFTFAHHSDLLLFRVRCWVSIYGVVDAISKFSYVLQLDLVINEFYFYPFIENKCVFKFVLSVNLYSFIG